MDRARRGGFAPLFCALLIAVSAGKGGPRAGALEEGWREAQSRLQRAVAAGAAREAVGAVRQLAASGDPRAYQAIIRHALRGRLPDLWPQAAGVLARCESPELRKVIYEAVAESPDPRTRIILLAVVRRWVADPLASRALHGRLSDRRKEVVFSALRWIREMKRPDLSLGPLVTALEKRERSRRDRVYFDLRATLKDLTGHDLAVAADWRNYLRARAAGAEPAAPKRGGRTVLYERPSFFTVSVDSDRVVFVIDVSGSMEIRDPVTEETPREKDRFVGSGVTVVRLPPEGGEGGAEGEGAPGTPRTRSRLSAVQKELIHTVEGLPESVRFTIIAFNHELRVFDAAPGLVPASAANKARAASWVRSFRPSGATRTDLAMARAFEIAEVDTIYLLTDGAPKDERNQRIAPEYVYALVREQNRFRKCRVNTIGFWPAGTSMRKFVQQLAKQNDGKCVLLR